MYPIKKTMLGGTSQVLGWGGVGITSGGGLFLNPTRMDGYEGLFSLFKICHLYVILLNNYAGRD